MRIALVKNKELLPPGCLDVLLSPCGQHARAASTGQHSADVFARQPPEIVYVIVGDNVSE